MILTVDFKDEQDYLEVRAAMRSIVRKAIFNTLAYEGFEKDVEVSVTFTDNEQIKELNSQYRNKDCATDVLSFPMFDLDEDLDMYPGTIPLGDIVISIDKVFEQAENYGHSVEREYAFLITHSMLHLFGYDHMEEEEAKVMEEKQKDILHKMNILR